uniref:RNA-dependent RNA polymerase n=1 Tax=Sclerotinia sclerotiorum mitovirus 33 TaxID=2231685 RepID=A0A2Z4QKI0_9VIRU|nr:RNA-dependent RNA polymerase [Sclerotinia sclerotiorum mitovirus 33]
MNKINFKLLKTEVAFVHRWYFPGLDFITQADVDYCLDRFERIYQTRGPLEAAREMKASRLLLTKWKAGQPMTGSVGAPMSKVDFLPKAYLTLKVRRRLKDDPDHELFRFCLTLLSISKIIMGGAPLDLSSITNPSTSKTTLTDIEISTGLKALGLRPGMLRPKWKRFHWASTAGPNGLSIAQAIRDLGLLPDGLLTSMVHIAGDSFGEAVKGCKGLISAYPTLWKLFSKVEPRTKYLRKLSIKDDTEGKSRPFAILDYWSQSALTPLHDELYRILGSLPQDCTFDQQKGVRLMQQYPRSRMHSLDLKSATDRFPLELQERILAWLTDAGYASAWKDVVNGYDFEFQGRSLRWTVGQPLGAKSSWAMFTLSHHVVVQVALSRAKARSDSYVLLGDDIVLRTTKLANAYLELMEGLGVEISPSKSHSSKGMFEFAKTWIHSGSHISGFPIKGLHETLFKISELIPVITDVGPMRGYPLPFSTGNLAEFSAELSNMMSKFSRQRINLGRKFHLMTSFVLACCDNEWMKSFVHQSTGYQTEHYQELFKRAVMVIVRDGKERELHQLTLFALGVTKSIHSGWSQLSYDALIAESQRIIAEGRSFKEIAAIHKRIATSKTMVSTTAPGTLSVVDQLSSTLPVLGALVTERSDRESWLNNLDVSNPDQFWEGFKSWDLKPFPQLKGLRPERVKTVTQARTSLASKLDKFLKLVS